MAGDSCCGKSCGAEFEGFRGPWWEFPPFRNAIGSGVCLALGVLIAKLARPVWLPLPAYVAAIVLGGWYWSREGWQELVEEREVGIEVLMAAATVGAAILGQWLEAAFLVFLYGAAEALESYTFARTRSAIRSLLDLAPKEARVLRDGREETVPAESLKPGDVFVVRPGESLPTDGIIRAGTSTMDEAPVTGESVPVEKGLGAPVFAGTINRQGALEVEATHAFPDNTLARIIHLVEEAQEEKGRAQQFIERFGRRYSPAVLGAAILLIVIPPLLGQPWGTWAVRAVVLLVAAAPCALVMSTPVAIAAGIGSAGRKGVLIKGGIHLENLGKIRVVAFDKTGTLTQGKPEVTTIHAINGTDQQEVLRLAASLEQLSEHPLAQAIVARATQNGSSLDRPDDFEALTGAGAQGRIRGTTWIIGSPALFSELGVSLESAATSISQLQAEGQTVVLLGNGHELRGLLALRDQVRLGTREAIGALHAAGVEQIVMLSGDNIRTATAIARELGIDEVRAELKPADKVAAVKELEARYGHVAMVGDGINDAPALAAATIGIAMGVAGTDAAIEAADVALMADDLAKVTYVIRLGRRARWISRQNIAFSLLILAALIPSALLGVLGVALAVTVHEVTELLAVGNGLRAARA